MARVYTSKGFVDMPDTVSGGIPSEVPDGMAGGAQSMPQAGGGFQQPSMPAQQMGGMSGMGDSGQLQQALLMAALRQPKQAGNINQIFSLLSQMQRPEGTEQWEQKIVHAENTTRAGETVVEDTHRALNVLDRYGRRAAGWGAFTGFIPESPARQLRNHIESIKSNIGIETLLRIKQEGSGLGQVPQRQLETLQRVLGELDPTMKPDDLKYNIERVQRIYEDILSKEYGVLGYSESEIENQMKTLKERVKNLDATRTTREGKVVSISDMWGQ